MRKAMILCATLAVAAPATAQTTEEAHRAVFAAFVDAQNDREYDRLDDLVAADMVRHSQATPGMEVMRGLDTFKEFLDQSSTEFPDWRIECPMVVAEGDALGVWCTFSGTQEGPMGPFPPTGRRMALDFAGILRFEEGKISEWWVTWDNLAGLTQLGHFPPAAPGPPGEGGAEGEPDR